MPNQRCPFCSVEALKNRIIIETPTLFVTLSNKWLIPGHTLVIPKRHVGAVFELPAREQEQLMKTALCFQQKIMEVCTELWNDDVGCDLRIHTRPFMRQTELAIPGHAHIHLQPRFYQDEYWRIVGRHEDEVFKVPSGKELDQFVALLSK